MRTATKTSPAASRRYVERINLAIDHVRAHLASPLRLKAVSRAAGLSPFHFHRVFQALVGETLADFVKRLRLERALARMAGPKPGPLTDIALDCGFSSSSDFSRCFRQRYGSAPSRFDLRAWREAHGAALDGAVGPKLTKLPAAENPDGFRVRVRDLPPRTVAYIRVHDPYRPGAVTGAAGRLVAWAQARGLAGGQWLGFQWDNPELTPLEKCCYHTAVEAAAFTGGGEVGRLRFPAMTVAEIEIRGDIHLELRALRWLYAGWLPRSGYVPDDHPCFEAWIGRPFAHGSEHFELRVQLPVRRP